MLARPEIEALTGRPVYLELWGEGEPEVAAQGGLHPAHVVSDGRPHLFILVMLVVATAAAAPWAWMGGDRRREADALAMGSALLGGGCGIVGGWAGRLLPRNG